MNENDPRLPLEDWLRAAYAGNEAGCPPPEAFLEAGTATPEERPEMWREMTSHWPDYDGYQTRTDREIPIVVLEPAPAPTAAG